MVAGVTIQLVIITFSIIQIEVVAAQKLILRTVPPRYFIVIRHINQMLMSWRGEAIAVALTVTIISIVTLVNGLVIRVLV